MGLVGARNKSGEGLKRLPTAMNESSSLMNEVLRIKNMKKFTIVHSLSERDVAKNDINFLNILLVGLLHTLFIDFGIIYANNFIKRQKERREDDSG